MGEGIHPTANGFMADCATPQHDAFDQAGAEDSLKLSVTSRRVGGLGIVLVRELGKDVSYSWSGGKNRVTFSVAADTPWPRRPQT